MGESAEGGESAFEHPRTASENPVPDAETPRGEEATPDPPQKPSYWMFSVLAALSAIADLASKAWAQARLAGYDPSLKGPKRVTVIDGYFDFVYAQNPGGAWSMLRGLPEIIRRPFFLFVSAVAIVFIVSIYARVDVRQRALRWGLPLALGGAIGNLVDRMRFGYVVDFIHLWTKYGGGEYHWPTFNVADVAIVLGVALMAVDLLFARKPHESEAAPASGAGEPSSQASPEGVALGSASQDASAVDGGVEVPSAPSSLEAMDTSPKQ